MAVTSHHIGDKSLAHVGDFVTTPKKERGKVYDIYMSDDRQYTVMNLWVRKPNGKYELEEWPVKQLKQASPEREYKKKRKRKITEAVRPSPTSIVRQLSKPLGYATKTSDGWHFSYEELDIIEKELGKKKTAEMVESVDFDETDKGIVIFK